MRIYIIFTGVIVTFFLCNLTTFGQERTQNPLPGEEIGIKILVKDFDLKVYESIKLLELNDTVNLNIQDIILWVRIYNTISFNQKSGEKLEYMNFVQLFNLNKNCVIQKLSAKISKGMGFYSKKYNIYLGGIPHYNSQFKIL
jgi:hypothetical protein